MTTPILPPFVPGYSVPAPNTTPFTYRDGLAYLQRLERIVKYIKITLVPYIETNYTELAEAFTTEVNKLIADVNAANEAQDAAIDAKIAALEALVAQAIDTVINDGVDVSDPVIYAILSNELTNSRKLLDRLYARVYSVRTWTELTDAITAIDAGSVTAVIHIPAGATITTQATIDLPDEVVEFRVDGTLIIGGDWTGITKRGVYSGSSYPITVEFPANTRTVSVAGTAGLAVGDWVFVASSDTNPRSTDKLGSMRTVRTIDVGSVQFDAPMNRAMTTLNNATIHKITMGRAVSFTGVGEIRYDTQTDRASVMLSLRWIHGVYIGAGLTLRFGGGTAVGLQHCVDVLTLANIREFRNDAEIAYGVSCGGACRNVAVLGHLSRVRHAATTNPGPGSGTGIIIAYAGEPENLYFGAETSFCTDKAWDTHDAGYNILIDMKESGGSGGGAHVRADAVTVKGYAHNIYGPAVQVSSGPWAVTPVIDIDPCNGVNPPVDSGGISLSGPAEIVRWPRINIPNGRPLIKVFNNVVPRVRPDVLAVAKTASQTVTNSAVLVNDSILTLPVEANGIYLVEAILITSADPAADVSVKLDMPVGALMYGGLNGLPAAAANAQSAVDVSGFEGNNPVTIGGVGQTTGRTVTRVQATLINGATAGALTVQFAQAVAHASNVIMHRGSWLRLSRIG